MLPDAITATVFAGALVFIRVGAMVMLLPGFGETFVPPRIRLAFAVTAAILLAPTLGADLPGPPEDPGLLAVLIGGEMLVGLVIGAVARLFMTALAVAGQVVGLQTGLAFAQAVDPALGQQGAIAGAFLNLTALTLIFVSGLHHLFLLGVRGSYEAFPPGMPIPAGDAAEWALQAFTRSFALGIQMAAPLLVFGLVFYLALGVLSRLMPQAQIFFIAMPSSILIGFAIFAVTLGAAMLAWLGQMESFARELS
jgi:flagellar biosynthetic protein FliR